MTPVVMLCLTRPTPARWVDVAVGDLDEVLRDHAHCEMKAAMNALSLVARAPDAESAAALVDLAEEEVRHVREVMTALAARNVAVGTPPADRYAAGLREIAHRTRPNGRSAGETLVDRLLVAAVI